jgi:hypothetical protein
MPTTTSPLTPRARRADASAPAVISAMHVDDASDPTSVYFRWRITAPADGTNLAAEFFLNEDGAFHLYAGTRDEHGGYIGFADGEDCNPSELRALARALTAIADRAEAEHEAARARLERWRRRYDAALEPIALATAQ